MSSEITKLIAYVGSQGVQDISRFSVIIDGIDISTSVLSVKLPGPKMEFLMSSYWVPNPNFYIPTGIRYPDTLLMEMLVPEVSEFNTTHGNFLNYLPAYMKSYFNIPNSGVFFGAPPTKNTFYWNRTSESSKTIEVKAYDRNNGINKRYVYFNCFYEKMLPIEFETSKADLQTVTLSFVVGGMKSPQ